MPRPKGRLRLGAAGANLQFGARSISDAVNIAPNICDKLNHQSTTSTALSFKIAQRILSLHAISTC
jgi:hypothetical protein